MRRFARLTELYGLVERIDAAAARIAADAVAEAVRLRASEEACDVEQRRLARAALAIGDRAGWLVADSAGEFAEARAASLARMQAQREVVRDQALAVYRASRLKTEQMARMGKGEREAAALEDGRRAQAVADDRYGARLEWTRAQARMKAG